ncbi:MAG: hypothetical protein HY516_00605 [Candidatus Aenigmarchaeota archaeon]|nr:hypothetical protein [Candidatus Aenigmarchaeota archaeon]
MAEEAVNLPMVLVGMLAIAAVIIGLLAVGAIPGINSAKENSDLQVACAQYQAAFGCGNKACAVTYDANKCKTMLESASVSTKNDVKTLWEMCKDAGLDDPKNCHIRCCGK